MITILANVLKLYSETFQKIILHREKSRSFNIVALNSSLQMTICQLAIHRNRIITVRPSLAVHVFPGRDYGNELINVKWILKKQLLVVERYDPMKLFF